MAIFPKWNIIFSSTIKSAFNTGLTNGTEQNVFKRASAREIRRNKTEGFNYRDEGWDYECWETEGGGKGAIVKNRNEISGRASRRRPFARIYLPNREGHRGKDGSGEKETEEQKDKTKEANGSNEISVATVANSRDFLGSWTLNGMSHLWQITTERTFLSTPYCIARILSVRYRWRSIEIVPSVEP